MQVSGNIVAPNKIWIIKAQTWIIFININGLTVEGHGEIDGQGAIWWPCVTERVSKLRVHLSIQLLTFPFLISISSIIDLI